MITNAWKRTRPALALLASLIPALALAQSAAPANQPPGGQTTQGMPDGVPASRIVLLGTAAGPIPRPDRAQPANLLQVGAKTYVIDVGDNAAQQMTRAGAMVAHVTAVFLTHLHYDHTLGLGALMAFGWMNGRNAALPIWGPPGTIELVSRTAAALDISANIFKPELPPRPALASLYPAHDITLDGDTPVEVYRDDQVRVTAVPNTHYATMDLPGRSYGTDQSYAYRFDTPQGSVVFTGDTGPSDAVTELAKGADVLVTEIMDLASVSAAITQRLGARQLDGMLNHMRKEHLTAEDVGRMAQKAGVKKVILTHFSVGDAFQPADFIPQVRQYYPMGDIVAGTDLGAYPLRGD
ncbi:MAG: MBL fold metallo-hydrolase [Azospirillaceae bacterium]|nr:MBL fold metallo-hydrolase [Azospirillaceae bacterium]